MNTAQQLHIATNRPQSDLVGLRKDKKCFSQGKTIRFLPQMQNPILFMVAVGIKSATFQSISSGRHLGFSSPKAFSHYGLIVIIRFSTSKSVWHWNPVCVSMVSDREIGCSSQCCWLVDQRPCHVLSWLCHNVCKISLAIWRRALCPISMLLLSLSSLHVLNRDVNFIQSR